ncbi:MAG: hypothetical protein JWQ09_2278 [Segetibacter sp.]|nr:hypothetical protein [Segetibacter sp.]
MKQVSNRLKITYANGNLFSSKDNVRKISRWFGGTSVRRNDVKSGNKCPVPKKKTYRNNAELILTILLR